MEILTYTEHYWLKAFQNWREPNVGEFYGLIVRAFMKADLNNRRALTLAFPEIAKGYQLWFSGEYNGN